MNDGARAGAAGRGRVFLVGAGPGDPGLLTLRGRDVLATADVVLYDALADARLLAHAPAAAEKLLVGKRHGLESVAQSDIEVLLVAKAREGKRVVRLKGGDPFIFGRGGEEAEACLRAGIPFEVVPGVTSATAVPAWAGIPLTHREHSSLVTFVTGHSGKARPGYDVDWAALARTGGTLVFLMAMTRIGEIAEALVAAGMDAATPAAAVRQGTLPSQRKVVGTLSTIAALAEEHLHRPPVIFVVGAVAALSGVLSWYERLPLFGRRIVVTRARHQAGALAARLEAAGAEVVEFPTIAIERLPVSGEDLDRACRSDWLVLTSTNGVECFFDALRDAGRDLRDLAGVRIAAVGSSTRAAVEAHGLRVAVTPRVYRAEELVEALGDPGGRKVLLARAESGRDVLPEALRERGATVEVLPLYRTVVPQPGQATLPDEFDMVTFTSASTVHGFEALGGNARQLLEGRAVASIGPVTSDALAALGVAVDVQPAESTIDAFAAAIEAFFANRQVLP